MTQNCEFLFGYTNLVVNGMIVLLTVLSFVVHKFRQLQEAELTEQNDRLLLLSTQDVCYRFSLDQMQRATSNFHDELVIGKGGFGNVYKGTFKVGPTIVAIKRLHSRSRQGPLEFRTEIEMLSKIRHSHLVSLIGYCDDDCEMILVYEFMPGGTLADHLYKRVRKGDKSTPTLSWVQRLKVCIGAARGLEYLHTGTGIQHRIIHRDVKTTNILLDENLAAKISDFGLSKISPANQATTDVSTHVKGTFGYLDPYYFSTHRLTRKSDVYSFGVVLLEVLCGRPAVDRTLDTEQMGLAGWAQHCFKEGLLGNIIDPKIKDEATPDCIEAFVKVAIQCLQFGPKHRPNMAEVVVALDSALVLQEKINDYILPEIIISDDHQDDIDSSKLDMETADSEKWAVGNSKGSHPEKQSSTRMTFTERVIVYKGHMQNLVQALRGRRKIREKNFKRNGGLLLTQQLSSSKGNVDTKLFTSKELDMATDHYNEYRILGQGGQGTVYKGMLKEGRLVAVKKSKMEDENIKEQFINEVLLLSNINHRNIVKLYGCCLETAVPLMVYEFIPNGTLFEYIHDYNEDFPLTWDIRVRVAIEIAGALFYLHSAASIPIYHRNIKSSNILLDEKYRAKLAGFGTSKLMAIDQTHLTTSRIQGTFGYLDPEYFQSSQFTDKSDVYSFGVVLVELLTGQKPILTSILDSEVRTLATHFILAMEENRIFDILDSRNAKEGREEEITAFANIAYRCLNLNRERRPTMKQVAAELESITLSKRLPISELQYEEIEDPVNQLNGHWDLTSMSMSSMSMSSSY